MRRLHSGATTAEQTSSFYRIPVKYGRCYIRPRARNREKVSPVERTRRRFSKRIEEGDTVEIADDLGEYVACGEF
jgi:hypothetical protein